MYELLGGVVMNYIPCDNVSNNNIHEFSEDMLDFLSLLLEEYLRVEKIGKAPLE